MAKLSPANPPRPFQSCHPLRERLTPVFGLQQLFPQVQDNSHNHHVIYDGADAGRVRDDQQAEHVEEHHAAMPILRRGCQHVRRS